MLTGVLNDGIGLMPSIAIFTAASTAMSLCPLLLPAWRRVDEPKAAPTPSTIA